MGINGKGMGRGDGNGYDGKEKYETSESVEKARLIRLNNGGGSVSDGKLVMG